MLTVLHIIGDEPHESVRRAIYDEAAFFSRHKVDVRFVCREPVAAGTRELAAALRRLGAPLYRLPIVSGDAVTRPTSHRGRLPVIGKAMTPALALREMCRAFPSDVIHSHTESAFRLACLARCLGAPAVHVYTPHIIKRRAVGFSVYAAVEACADRFWANWCDEFIAVDDRAAAALPARYAGASKINRINYGLDVSAPPVDAERARANGSDIGRRNRDGRFVLLLAADSDDTGGGIAAEFFAELALRISRGYVDVRDLSDTRYAGLRLVFTSASPGLTDYARELAASRDLEELLEIRAGRATAAERADLCVYYSDNRFFPYPAAEALAAGVPTLTNDRYFNAELAAAARAGEDGVPESLFEADVGRPEALARRVLELICDGAARAAVAEAGRRAVRARFDIEDMLMGIYDLYVRGLGV